MVLVQVGPQSGACYGNSTPPAPRNQPTLSGSRCSWESLSPQTFQESQTRRGSFQTEKKSRLNQTSTAQRCKTTGTTGHDPLVSVLTSPQVKFTHLIATLVQVGHGISTSFWRLFQVIPETTGTRLRSVFGHFYSYKLKVKRFFLGMCVTSFETKRRSNNGVWK